MDPRDSRYRCGACVRHKRLGGLRAVPGNFVRRIDNPWFPLIPGTTFVYRGVKDGKHARDVVTVTDGTKTIKGVRCTGVRDRLYLPGRLEGRTIEWFGKHRS